MVKRLATEHLKALDIVLDGKPGHNQPRFLELETTDGRSMRFGRWVRKGKVWALRLPVSIEIPAKKIQNPAKAAARQSRAGR